MKNIIIATLTFGTLSLAQPLLSVAQETGGGGEAAVESVLSTRSEKAPRAEVRRLPASQAYAVAQKAQNGQTGATVMDDRTGSVIVQSADGSRVSVRAAKSASSGQTRSLVIQTSGDLGDRPNLHEDLAVMLRLLDKAASQNPDGEPARRAMGINLMFSSGATPVRSLYLDGYGALFFLNVAYPLVPPPSKPEVTAEQPKTDSAWEEARREIYGEAVGAKLPSGLPGSQPSSSVQEYSESKVTALKDGLLGVLKDAANIRDLKSDEFVTVCVFGGPPAGASKAEGLFDVFSGSQSIASLGDLPIFERLFKAGGEAARGTYLTLRVKKSDADAFSKDKLTLDQFRLKVGMAAYDGDKVPSKGATKR